jgi:broad specificity phosphatase PhoE
MGELLLVRHGETAWSVSGQHTGNTEIALTAHGEAQARAVAPMLAKHDIGVVLVSPRQRARHTAELAGLSGVADYRITPELSEWDYGAYEGVTTATIHQTRPDWDLWRDGVPPGDAEHPGETVEQVGARCDSVIATVCPMLGHGQAGYSDVVLVAHGHLLRIFTARWLGLPAADGALFRLDTATVSKLGFEHDRRVISAWNLDPSGAL